MAEQYKGLLYLRLSGGWERQTESQGERDGAPPRSLKRHLTLFDSLQLLSIITLHPYKYHTVEIIFILKDNECTDNRKAKAKL